MSFSVWLRSSRGSSCSVFLIWKQSWSQLFHLAPWCVARASKLLEMRNLGSIEVQKSRLEILKNLSGVWIQRVTMRWPRAAEKIRSCQSWQTILKTCSFQRSWHEDETSKNWFNDNQALKLQDTRIQKFKGGFNAGHKAGAFLLDTSWSLDGWIVRMRHLFAGIFFLKSCIYEMYINIFC